MRRIPAPLVAGQPPVVERDHAAAHLVDHLAVVRRHHDRRPGAVDPVEQLHDPDRGVGVEVPGRLVADQKRRVVDDGARDRDALLLTARELVGKRGHLVREPDEVEHLGHLAADRAAAFALHLQRVGDVLGRRTVREQLEVLEDAADVAAQVRHLRALEARQVAAADDDLARGRLDLLQHEPDHRRLARAGGPDDEDEVALLDHERDVRQRGDIRLVDLAHGVENDHRAGGRRRQSAVAVHLGPLDDLDRNVCLELCVHHRVKASNHELPLR